MISDIMLSVTMLSVIMLNVIMLSVVEPLLGACFSHNNQTRLLLFGT
jgi:hypothetical protein